jgi:hypothetical protein
MLDRMAKNDTAMPAEPSQAQGSQDGPFSLTHLLLKAIVSVLDGSTSNREK